MCSGRLSSTCRMRCDSSDGTPAAGVPSHDSGKVLAQLEKLSSDIAVLIIEHDMDLVFRFASRITVLVQGQVLVEGTPAEIAADKRVRDVYLGEGHG